MVFNKIASTKAPETAWRLIECLREAFPFLAFVMVMSAPDSAHEVHALGGVHPKTLDDIRDKVKQFRQAVL